MEAVKKKKKIGKKWIALIVIVVIIGVLLVACMGMKKMAEAKLAAMNAMQTGEVTVRPLTKSIGATGTLISVRSRDLTVALSGIDVMKVNVEVGDVVEEGQALVEFDTEDIEKNLNAARNALGQTQGQYGISTENAQRQVDDAIRSGEYSVEMAQKNVDMAYQAYLDAWDALEDAEDAEDNAWEKFREAEVAAATDANAEQSLPQLKLAAEQASAAVEQAKSAIDSLYDQYEIAQMNYENAVATAESSIAAAKAAQQSTELGQNTDQQVLQIDALNDQLAEGALTAPFAGVITAVNVEEGDTYLQGAVLTIQDCSAYEIEAQIGEYDIADIKLGQKVLIKTDSTRNQELEGTVVFVSPTATPVVSAMGTTTATDPTYEIRISVDTPSDRLRLDMTATLSIIIEERESAMTVPYNAVQTAEDGSSFVEVVGADGESLTVVPVTVLLESNYYTEISGNLKQGDIVRLVEQEASDMFSVMSDLSGGF